jgi:hypothetical protein
LPSYDPLEYLAHKGWRQPSRRYSNQGGRLDADIISLDVTYRAFAVLLNHDQLGGTADQDQATNNQEQYLFQFSVSYGVILNNEGEEGTVFVSDKGAVYADDPHKFNAFAFTVKAPFGSVPKS